MTGWRDTPTLVGNYVTLRPFSAADHDALATLADDGELASLFYTSTTGLRAPHDYLAAAFREAEVGRAMLFAVIVADRLVGMTRYMRMNEEHRRLEIGGTFYAAEVRRTGVNTEAKRLLLAHAFDTMGCNVVELRTDWLNRGSQAAIERLGAKRDGVLRAHAILDGRVRDMVCYSIVASEWPGVSANLNFLLTRGGR